MSDDADALRSALQAATKRLREFGAWPDGPNAAWLTEADCDRFAEAALTAAFPHVQRFGYERGRQEALTEAAAKLQGLAADQHGIHGDAANGTYLMAAGIVRGMAKGGPS